MKSMMLKKARQLQNKIRKKAAHLHWVMLQVKKIQRQLQANR